MCDSPIGYTYFLQALDLNDFVYAEIWIGSPAKKLDLYSKICGRPFRKCFEDSVVKNSFALKV